jgi:hypothetical protein
MSRSHIVL